jgi:cytochrome o ubiquinol oxidase subunit 2
MKISKQLKLLILIISIVICAGTVGLAIWFLSNHNIAVLNPKGTIADQQRQLIITATLLMSIVVVPVLALTFAIAWRYREGNKKAKYSPDLDGNKFAEIAWWIVPLIIIAILASITVATSRTLDPFRSIASNKQPLKIQVIALQWKWLFIYPEQHVASINYLPIPTDRPISFDITADAPMNSFWIPQLGGQIYAMSGMSTQLHLQADQPGDYRGSSANISGEGFSSMAFTAHASSQADFDKWVTAAQKSKDQLTLDAYNELAKPSKDLKPAAYTFPAAYDGLYDTVVMKYMTPQKNEGSY